MVLARRSASGTDAWYLTDHLGSVRDIANTSGTVIDHISYSVYGNVTNETQSSNGDRFKYTGREFDSETVLHSYRARIYDASIGRFLSTDPISFSGDDENLYRYVRNAPTGWTDETGQSRRYGSGDWVDKAANYFAGIGDSLTFHATYAFREALGINGGIDTGSGYYIAGEITEMTAEITVSAGGAALRRAAAQVVHKTAGAAARKQAAKAIPHIPTDAARHHINTLFGYPAIPGGRAWRPARFPTGGFSAKWNSCWANLKVVFDDVHDLLGRRAHLVEEFVYHTTTAEFISARAVVNTLFTKTEEHEQQANPPQ
jgi:RHS repeat-associated protein